MVTDGYVWTQPWVFSIKHCQHLNMSTKPGGHILEHMEPLFWNTSLELTRDEKYQGKVHINWHQRDSVNSDNGKLYIEVCTIQKKKGRERLR